MSHRNKRSLVKQITDRFDSMLAIGQSKHTDKQLGITHDRIYSWSTYRAYIKHCCYFVHWCKDNYGCRTLNECRPYVAAWINTRKNLSAPTQKLEVSALSKLYGIDHHRGKSPFDDVRTDARKRVDIKRSRRNDVVRDKHFSDVNNADLVTFCRCSGLRRAELQELRFEDLRLAAPDGSENTGLYVHHNTKGGRPRRIDFVGTPAEIEICYQIMLAGHGQDKVWGKVHSAADIHSYRADYATRVYNKYARPINTLSHDEIYYCRGDKKGVWLDKQAMRIASNALGHNRISIIAGNYLRV